MGCHFLLQGIFPSINPLSPSLAGGFFTTKLPGKLYIKTKTKNKNKKLKKSHSKGFTGDSMAENLPANAGDMGSIPGWGGSPAEGNGNPLQDSCLENPMDRGAWQATVHGVAESWTQLSDWTTARRLF